MINRCEFDSDKNAMEPIVLRFLFVQACMCDSIVIKWRAFR
jgi:hypothetical protein